MTASGELRPLLHWRSCFAKRVGLRAQASRDPRYIGKRFVADMRRLYREPNPIKRDGDTMRMLREHYSGRLRVPDVKRMFAEMRDDGEGR